MKFKKDDHVLVDFVSDAKVDTDGIHIYGHGVLDLAEDGYVFGRLIETGSPFGCPERYVQMFELNAGDYVLKNVGNTSSVFEVISKYKISKRVNSPYKYRIKNIKTHLETSVGVRGIERFASANEVVAGYRQGTPNFDQYWYGQSEADAIAEHLAYQEELIPGGATLVVGADFDESKLSKIIKEMK
ncbi:hypothetical protein KPE71_14075 [Acinetobacter soli]|uniref:hypothetical protein n=1 Tax=Acinetobacter soli TaxID=487316 RepID=UPI001C0D90DF|nr:hypothetical protein [Acinetobacter soli]MBU3121380.1 hypothetical protein [Acinetobacter soli]